MGRQRPKSVSRATLLQVAMAAVLGLIVLATWAFDDALVRTWVEREATAKPPAFVPVAVVALVVYSLLVWVLTLLFRDGNNWARLSLTGVAAFVLVAMAVLFRHRPPAVFPVLGVVGVLVDLALVSQLWHRETGRFLRGVEQAEEIDEFRGAQDTGSQDSEPRDSGTP